MPKLIIKQETSAVSQRMKHAKWLSVGGLLLLLITVATAAVLFTKSPVKSADLGPLSLNSASNSAAKSSYELLYAILGELDTEYESVAGHDVDDYQKNLKLLGKSESILSHLNKMDAAARDLGLDANEQKELLDRHQFYKDYWQAKLHFRELRVSRFESQGKPDQAEAESVASDAAEELTPPVQPALPDNTNDASVEESPQADVVAEDGLNDDSGAQKPKKKFQFAKPPEGMELPEGFCDLTDPASCKPEVGLETDGVLQDLALPDGSGIIPGTVPDNSEQAATEKPKKKFQFAKPPAGMELPEGFCDLSNPDSCKPEEDIGAVDSMEGIGSELAIDQEVSAKPKKKFQFAKPPEGMKLPEGFCDLTNPDSCKPEAADGTAVPAPFVEIAPEPTAESDESIKPKRKFQFAKPPEGMELPAGFCDLNNPASCKPEAGNTSEASNDEAAKKKVMNREADSGSAEKKSQKNTNNEQPAKQVEKKKTAKQQKSSSASKKAQSEKPEKSRQSNRNQQASKSRKSSRNEQASKSRERDFQILEESLGIPLN